MKTHYVRRVFLALAGLSLTNALPAADPASVLTPLPTITLKGKAGKLDHLAIDGKRQRLFLANTINGTVDVVDLKASKLMKQIAGQPGVQGVAYAADLDRLFVGLGSGGLCNVFAGDDYRPLKTIKFADDADNVRYDAASHQVFVAHAEQMLGVVDAQDYAVKADIKLPGVAEGFQIAAGLKRMFLVIPSPSQVVVIDTDKKAIMGSHPINMAGGGHAIALDEANKRTFIGCRKEPMVVVMDTETGKEITSIPIPKDNDDVFYDAKRKRLYASCGEGFVVVIRQVDANKYEVQEKVATAKAAKTSFYDADTSRLYVAVPRQPSQEGPEIRVFQVRD
jgi:DNA-binding beta-propeller fold protein YncE